MRKYIIIALAIVLSLFSVNAFAAEAVTFSSSNVNITGAPVSISMPATFDNIVIMDNSGGTPTSTPVDVEVTFTGGAGGQMKVYLGNYSSDPAVAAFLTSGNTFEAVSAGNWNGNEVLGISSQDPIANGTLVRTTTVGADVNETITITLDINAPLLKSYNGGSLYAFGTDVLPWDFYVAVVIP